MNWNELHLPQVFWPILFLILAAMSVVVLNGLISNERKIVTPLLWAGGALMTGVLGGFIFCCPKVDKLEPVADKNASSIALARHRLQLAINTNLTEISDWLCKIIVGLGLIELKNIPGYVFNLSNQIAKDMGHESYTSFASGLLVVFLGSGFLLGYLVTRLKYSILFSIADDLTTNAGVSGRVAILEREAAENDRKLGEMEILTYEINGIQAQREDADPYHIEKSIELLKKVLGENPDRRQSAMILSVLYAIKKKDFGKARAVCESAIHAIESRRHTAPEPSDQENISDLLYNTACWYAQEIKLLKEQNQDTGPSMRSMVDVLQKSAKLKHENAVAARNDPDFKAILSQEDIGKIFASVGQ